MLMIEENPEQWPVQRFTSEVNHLLWFLKTEH